MRIGTLDACQRVDPVQLLQKTEGSQIKILPHQRPRRLSQTSRALPDHLKHWSGDTGQKCLARVHSLQQALTQHKKIYEIDMRPADPQHSNKFITGYPADKVRPLSACIRDIATYLINIFLFPRGAVRY